MEFTRGLGLRRTQRSTICRDQITRGIPGTYGKSILKAVTKTCSVN